jgi:ribosome biogenesis GTPase / thiamine phosphate phosphatase
MRLAMDHNTTYVAEKFAAAGAWDIEREIEFAPLSSEGVVPGRVFSANRELFQIKTAAGEVEAIVAGRLRQEGDGKSFPVAGDWAAVDIRGTQAVLHYLLSRRSFFSRRAAGGNAEEQIVAANIDYALIALGLDRDFNLNRLDRYLVQARYGNVQPVVVLTKADLCSDVESHLARTEYELGGNIKVHAISVKRDYGLTDLDPYLQPGLTCLLIGSSGVGKSTLINRLVGEGTAATGAVSQGNGRGRCITSCARIFETRAGALLIDSPGIREVQLWANDTSFDSAFEDIVTLAASCKFRDCAHHGEPGCAVREALSQNLLTQERFHNYMKLRHELGETKATMLRAKEQRFKNVAIWARQHRRMSRE